MTGKIWETSINWMDPKKATSTGQEHSPSRRIMPSARASLVALLVLLALVSEASAKLEKRSWDRTSLTPGPSYRTDFCAISEKYAPRQLNYAPRQQHLPPPLGSKAAALPVLPALCTS